MMIEATTNLISESLSIQTKSNLDYLLKANLEARLRLMD